MEWWSLDELEESLSASGSQVRILVLGMSWLSWLILCLVQYLGVVGFSKWRMGKETYLKQALFGSVLSLFPEGKIPSLSDKQRLWTEFIEPGSTSFPPGYLPPWENPAFSAFSGHVFFQFLFSVPQILLRGKASRMMRFLIRMCFIWPPSWVNKQNSKAHGILTFGVTVANYFVISVSCHL